MLLVHLLHQLGDRRNRMSIHKPLYPTVPHQFDSDSFSGRQHSQSRTECASGPSKKSFSTSARWRPDRGFIPERSPSFPDFETGESIVGPVFVPPVRVRVPLVVLKVVQQCRKLVFVHVRVRHSFPNQSSVSVRLRRPLSPK